MCWLSLEVCQGKALKYLDQAGRKRIKDVG